MNIIKKLDKSKSGFTLIEVLITIAVIGIILAALFNVNISSWKFFNFNQDRTELMNEARLITVNIERNIRNATEATILNEGENNNEEIELNDGKIFWVDYSNGLGKLVLYNGSSDRGITTNVIESHNFEKINNLIKFKFTLIRDNARYVIYNQYYPRTEN